MPVCAVGLTVSYSDGMLKLGSSIGSAQPYTWTTRVFQGNVFLDQLWSVALPAESPAVTRSRQVPFTSTGGNITVVSGLYDSHGTVVCEENATVNTAE
jgi:hypothetical protein